VRFVDVAAAVGVAAADVAAALQMLLLRCRCCCWDETIFEARANLAVRVCLALRTTASI